METNRCLNLQAAEGRVGDKKLKRAEKVSNEVEVPNAVEDINLIHYFRYESLLRVLVSVRKSLASRPASSMTSFFGASFCAFGQ